MDAQEIYNFIESQAEKIETYQLDSKKVSKAGIDYIIILNAVGSVASIASLLWTAYEKFIKPAKINDDTGGLYINIDSQKEGRTEFWLGNTDKDKEVFIQNFTTKISSFQKTESAAQLYEVTELEIKHSGSWIKRK